MAISMRLGLNTKYSNMYMGINYLEVKPICSQKRKCILAWIDSPLIAQCYDKDYEKE